MDKLCNICNLNPRKRSGSRFLPWCAPCDKVKQKAYRAVYLSDPVKKERNNRAGKLFRERNPEVARARNHAAFLALKREMLAAYGPNCACCGEDRENFLTLEHVNRDGKAHRDLVGGGTNAYRDLKRRGWPKEGFSVLCMNCNWATRFGGECPHKTDPR